MMFYILYISAGISDMVDGYIARKTDNVTEHGALLDTIGDVIFLFVCLYVLMPVIALPSWIIVWIGMILVIKVINIIISDLQKMREKDSVRNMMLTLKKSEDGMMVIFWKTNMCTTRKRLSARF